MNHLAREQYRLAEHELKAEIHRIGGRLERASALDDQRSRCAASYLRELLRDRQETLATLRVRARRLN